MRFLYFFFVLVLFANNINAQEQNQNRKQKHRFSILPTVGVTQPILDGGKGIYLGLNPSVRLNQWFSAEGQLSFRHTNISHSFLSGYKGYSNHGDALLGLRIYLRPEEKRTRFYINLMYGIQYSKGKLEYMTKESISRQAGFSGGVFAEINNFVIGLSWDHPEIALKVGYSF